MDTTCAPKAYAPPPYPSQDNSAYVPYILIPRSNSVYSHSRAVRANLWTVRLKGKVIQEEAPIR